ncbi:MAG TPA: tyrosine-type recombinase/integrase [Ktedonobacteraceae bacterium]|nr:tyrosine-type recombinase/integrase [Ktedonobacteraceae bacterium]
MQREYSIIPQDTPEDKLIDLWVRTKKSQHTRSAYRHDIEVFREFVGKPLASVTLEDAIDFCEGLDELEIMSKRGEIKLLEDNSKRRIINAVKSFYSFAHKSGLFPANVMVSIKPPSAKSAISRRILPEAAVLKMIIMEQDPRNHAILHTLYAAGLRVSELCNLRWRNVIRRAGGVQLDIISGKGDKQRYVLLGESSWQVLSPLREGASADDFVFQSRQEVSRDGHYKGAHMDTSTIFRIVREAAKRAGVENWREVSPHWLRHCHGSHAIDRHAPLTVVRDTLGHSNIAVTNEYAKARPDQSSAHYLPL